LSSKVSERSGIYSLDVVLAVALRDRALDINGL
jgi:hypothetical protein